MTSLLSASPDLSNKALKLNKAKPCYILIASDRGLIGGYNNQLFKFFDEYIKNHKNRVPANHLLLFNPYQRPKRILRSLMRKANDSLTERGVNILYISFGFVSWKEKDDLNTEYKAPLLLVPITITNDAYNKPYFIHLFDDDVAINQTFEYLLENQYGIKLNKYEDQDIEEYISDIELQLLPLGWKVTREAKIGIFSFNKLNMYLDLEENKDEIIANPNTFAVSKITGNAASVRRISPSTS